MLLPFTRNWTRTRLAHRYIRGTGIEFGALNVPLRVPIAARVMYADIHPTVKLETLYRGLPKFQRPSIITNIETMEGVNNASQDFVIANHVIEHVENPVQALASIFRVLRPSGIAYITLPDKRHSFDRSREVTQLDHVLRDFHDGPDWSRKDHYVDWAKNVMKLTGDALITQVETMHRDRENIHFHTWDHAAMTEMFEELSTTFGYHIEQSHFNRSEVIWILRKAATTPETSFRRSTPNRARPTG